MLPRTVAGPGLWFPQSPALRVGGHCLGPAGSVFLAHQGWTRGVSAALPRLCERHGMHEPPSDGKDKSGRDFFQFIKWNWSTNGEQAVSSAAMAEAMLGLHPRRGIGADLKRNDKVTHFFSCLRDRMEDVNSGVLPVHCWMVLASLSRLDRSILRPVVVELVAACIQRLCLMQAHPHVFAASFEQVFTSSWASDVSALFLSQTGTLLMDVLGELESSASPDSEQAALQVGKALSIVIEALLSKKASVLRAAWDVVLSGSAMLCGLRAWQNPAWLLRVSQRASSAMVAQSWGMAHNHEHHASVLRSCVRLLEWMEHPGTLARTSDAGLAAVYAEASCCVLDLVLHLGDMVHVDVSASAGAEPGSALEPTKLKRQYSAPDSVRIRTTGNRAASQQHDGRLLFMQEFVTMASFGGQDTEIGGVTTTAHLLPSLLLQQHAAAAARTAARNILEPDAPLPSLLAAAPLWPASAHASFLALTNRLTPVMQCITSPGFSWGFKPRHQQGCLRALQAACKLAKTTLAIHSSSSNSSFSFPRASILPVHLPDCVRETECQAAEELVRALNASAWSACEHIALMGHLSVYSGEVLASLGIPASGPAFDTLQRSLSASAATSGQITTHHWLVPVMSLARPLMTSLHAAVGLGLADRAADVWQPSDLLAALQHGEGSKQHQADCVQQAVQLVMSGGPVE